MNEIKLGKAPGFDGISVKCLKKGDMAVLDWIVRRLIVSFDMRVVPADWREACIASLNKWKGDKCDCSSLRLIRLLSVVGKQYGRVQIKRVTAETVCALGEEQCGFMHDNGCIEQVFNVMQVCEK